MPECRSELIAVDTETGDEWLSIAGATVLEAAYDCIEMCGDLTTIRDLLASGCTQVTVLDKRTPADVLKLLKGMGNYFNTIGSQQSFVEVLCEVEQIEKSWRVYRKDRRSEDEWI